MACTRSSTDGRGEDEARSTVAETLLAVENQLLRQQVQDLAGQLSVLAELVQ